MLAVDLSGSMKQRDFELKQQLVDRLTATKAVAGDFIRRRAGDRIGLILFGDQAYLQTPLTFDRQTVQQLLDESVLGLAGERTAIGDAIGIAIKRLQNRPKSNRVLILMTDGANTAGRVDPQEAAEMAASIGLKIYTVGIGSESQAGGFFNSGRSDLDEQALIAIASVTQGQYFRARDTAEFERIYDRLDQLEPIDQKAETWRPQQDLFRWPLLAALLFWALALWARRVWGARS